jgi:hypothetical protein
MVARVQKSASQARDDAALSRGGIDAGRLEAAAIGIFGDSDDPPPTMAREQWVKYVRSNPPLDASLIARMQRSGQSNSRSWKCGGITSFPPATTMQDVSNGSRAKDVATL